MEGLQQGELSLDVGEDGDLYVVSWKGKSEESNPGAFLDPFFEKVLAGGKAGVRLDFRSLEFMNSSTVPPLMRLLKALSEKNLRGEFVYLASLKWQVASFKALESVVQAQKMTNVVMRGE